MSMRPRSHEIEDKSRLRLREAFGDRGWVVWDLYPDYGEDLLVRIFTNSDATHYSFFVQAKSTDNLERYSRKDGIRFPVKVTHLRRWRDFWEPVILTVWDSKTDMTYWEIVQDQLHDKDLTTKRKEIAVTIPYANILNEKGIDDILDRTRKRIRRFERLSSGTSLLMKIFEERLGVKVEYDLDSDAFIIKWSDGELSLYAFDEAAALATEYASEQGVEPAGALFAALFKSVIEEMASRGEEEQKETLVFRKKDSMNVFSARENITVSSMTIEDFTQQGFLDRYLKRKEMRGRTEQ